MKGISSGIKQGLGLMLVFCILNWIQAVNYSYAQQGDSERDGGVVRSRSASSRHQLTSPNLSQSASSLGMMEVVLNTDFVTAGLGGMRGVGSGTLTVTGISGPVTKATLYWAGPTNSNSPDANANVAFGGVNVTGANIGFADSICWGFLNSQAYRADVTSLVPGNGIYSLSNFTKPNAEVNGASLIVFFNDGNTSNNRDVYLIQGNDSNEDDRIWNDTISGINYASGSARLQFHVSDSQSAPEDALFLNGSVLVPQGQIFSGDSVPLSSGCCGPPSAESTSGGLWDIKSFDITSFLSPGTNNLTLNSGILSDCLALIVLLADVPSVIQFDRCLQDDSSQSVLRFNSTTGAYQFSNCSGFTLSGTGSLLIKGGVITLQDTSADRRVVARMDLSVNKGSASIQVFSQPITFTITDRNTSNNTCNCAPG